MGCVDVGSSLQPKDRFSLSIERIKWESSFEKSMAFCISSSASLPVCKALP